MTRPHIEFIQSQVIPFVGNDFDGARPGLRVRTLSQDLQTGASSTVIQYPKNWRSAGLHALAADEEIFVLEGELTVNGRVYGKHFYGHWPKGYAYSEMQTSSGAVVLSFFSEAARATRSVQAEPDARRLVEALDTRNMAGVTGQRRHMNSGEWDASGTVHKTLYVDPDTQERTWLIGMMPYWSSNKAEIHPVVEEEFAILGDICFPLGVMRPGGYFWRPPGIQHGPFATWGGALHLCRCKGGPFATQWVETDGPDWNPPYTPVLPEPYATWAAQHNSDIEPNY